MVRTWKGGSSHRFAGHPLFFSVTVTNPIVLSSSRWPLPFKKTDIISLCLIFGGMAPVLFGFLLSGSGKHRIFFQRSVHLLQGLTSIRIGSEYGESAWEPMWRSPRPLSPTRLGRLWLTHHSKVRAASSRSKRRRS